MTWIINRVHIARATADDERGNALLLALLFVVVFGLLLGSILNFAGTGINTAERISEVRDQQDAIDGAVQGAISSLRTAQLGPVDGDCTSPNTFTPPAANGDPSIYVTCTRKPLSGTPAPPTDVPNWAILTVGTAAGEGLHADITGTGNNLQVNGGIFSYGDITVSSNNTLSVVGRAVGKAVNPAATCDAARILATVPVRCATTDPTMSSADAASYAYPHQAIAIPTSVPPTSTPVDPVPTCPGGPGTVVNFHPGIYTVLPTSLEEATTCNGDVWWFKPGTYYMHFPNSDGLWDVTTPTSVSVIGGTVDCTGAPTCTAPSAGGTDGSGYNDWTAPTIGNSSSNNLNNRLGAGRQTCKKGGTGVQFILGGKSQLKAGGSSTYLQLCAKDGSGSPASQQQIAMYVLNADESSSTAQSNISKLGSGFGNPTGNVAFTTTPSETAKVTVAKNSPTTPKIGSFTVGAFEDIPEGSIVTRMRVQIDHAMSNSNPPSSALTFTLPSGANAGTCSIGTASPVTCDIVPNTPTGATGIGGSKQPVWRDFNSATATYTVSQSGNSGADQTDTITGIKFIVDYRPQWFEQSTLASSDYVLDTFSPNATSRIYGTVWAPSGALKIKLHGGGISIYHRGIIARTVDASVISSSTQDDAPFQLPSSNAGREVVLVAHLNSATGPTRLKARVQFVDVNDKGTSDVSDDVNIPGYKVKVLNWQVVRP